MLTVIHAPLAVHVDCGPPPPPSYRIDPAILRLLGALAAGPDDVRVAELEDLGYGLGLERESGAELSDGSAAWEIEAFGRGYKAGRDEWDRRLGIMFGPPAPAGVRDDEVFGGAV